MSTKCQKMAPSSKPNEFVDEYFCLKWLIKTTKRTIIPAATCAICANVIPYINEDLTVLWAPAKTKPESNNWLNPSNW